MKKTKMNPKKVLHVLKKKMEGKKRIKKIRTNEQIPEKKGVVNSPGGWRES